MSNSKNREECLQSRPVRTAGKAIQFWGEQHRASQYLEKARCHSHYRTAGKKQKRTCSMKVLLVALIPLVGAFLNSNSSQLKSRSPEQSAILSRLKRSNAAYGRCQSGWTYFEESHACYKTFTHWVNMYDAERSCRNYGAYLASIHSDAENYFVAELSRMGKPWTDWHDLTWIGLKQPNSHGEWFWTDGTRVDYLKWAPGEPNDWKGIQHCVTLICDPHADVALSHIYLGWDDFECSGNVRAYVCKKQLHYVLHY
ncbi:unnamed protein product [Cylicocyclus nassatus]|uniref:C-type lectin domain-containing protein n=1 Tax=Cylicocyclus nassatus TaxID=53992 RepID=A0AA36H0S6_CYLNA|nr:unnamed protein product [Cylicocyclus nassatus]